MKIISRVPLSSRNRFWVLIVNILALTLLMSCASSESTDSTDSSDLSDPSDSSDSSTPAEPQYNLSGRVFVLGAQVDDFGNLVLYANGTDLDGEVLTVADLQTANITVDGVSYNTTDDPELTITPIVDGDKILSLGLLTDYSGSTGVVVESVADILTQMLDDLPLVFEAQVMTFSNQPETHLAWTEDLAAIKNAVRIEHSLRDETALYDSMGVALEGDAGTDGLVGRCRPAHMLVVFTDGYDNASSVYSNTDIGTIVNNDRTVAIMLGTTRSEADVLQTLVGDFGAVVQVTDPAGLEPEVDNWTNSLNNMVKITLDSSINTTGNAVSITIGSQTVDVSPNTHCTLTP